MALYKNGAFVEDSWRNVREGEDMPPAGHIVVPLDWWLAERNAFDGSNAPIGIRVEPGTKIEEFAGDIPRLSLIVLAFPKFGDGRAFSTAQLLRTRFGFRGELRASGDILLDQIQPLLRCGFDSFEIGDEATIASLKRGALPGVKHFYQPSLALEAPAGTRPWQRRPA